MGDDLVQASAERAMFGDARPVPKASVAVLEPCVLMANAGPITSTHDFGERDKSWEGQGHIGSVGGARVAAPT